MFNHFAHVLGKIKDKSSSLGFWEEGVKIQLYISKKKGLKKLADMDLYYFHI